MIDPELKYCPKCKDEYRAEIVACGVCGAALLSGAELLDRQRLGAEKRATRKGELSEADDLVGVRRGPLGEMRIYEQLLKAEGIASLLAGDDRSCGKGCCPSNFDLVVRRERLSGMAGRLSGIGPLGTLGRGYAIVRHRQTEAVVRSVAQVAPGDALDIRVADGEFTADVAS